MLLVIDPIITSSNLSVISQVVLVTGKHMEKQCAQHD